MKESQTEEQIIRTAKKIFFVDGNFHAKTQDIANEAGVNRALIHYYFRTREQLMNAVLQQAMCQMSERLYSIVLSELDFKDKIKQFISVFIDEALQAPYLENFVVHEFNRLKQCSPIPHKELIDTHFKSFFDELADEMKAGHVVEMTPIQFIVNMIAMCAYPISTRPLIQRSFDMTDQEYLLFLEQQKELIFRVIYR